MLIKKPNDIPSSEITPEGLYLNRRKFILGATAALGAVAAGISAYELAVPESVSAQTKLENLKSSPLSTNEKQTSFKDVTTYNNFYEFGTSKEDPSANAGSLKTRPWTVAISGEVKKPQTLDIDSILKMAPLEERIYRLRCDEGWSMVIPWVGFSLSELIKRVEPTSKAKYIEFTSLADPKQMPGLRGFGANVLDWPYTEGLRMDEAMHPLTLLAVGLYGQVLPNQNGAPVRIVIPWKYGFKSAKSIVKIRFTDREPATAWNKSAPHEYGFYSNVNPKVDHPRWSQAKERRIGEFFKRDTLMFNGYADQVASLYNGMDLRKNY